MERPSTSPEALAHTIHEMLGDALPDYADVLLKKNIKWGIIIHPQRVVVDTNKDILSKSMKKCACLYTKRADIMMGFETNEHREDAMRRLREGRDGDQPIQLEVSQSQQSVVQSIAPIIFGSQVVNLQPAQPSVPSAQPAPATSVPDLAANSSAAVQSQQSRLYNVSQTC